MGETEITVWAPASLSNLGPGFDTLGVAVVGPGDRVTLRLRDDDRLVVRVANTETIPEEADRNTASVAVTNLFGAVGFERGADLTVEKGIPLGSGLGGSAASAAAGALAAALATDCSDEKTVVRAALAGEKAASGSLHGDNVIPSLRGGFVLLNSRDPQEYYKLSVPVSIHFAILVPELAIETALARDALPERVPFQEAVDHSSSLGLLLRALCDGDVAAVGRAMMTDFLVEPIRAQRLPFFDAVRQAALSVGAPGCAVSGSGPAMVAACATRQEAEVTCSAMEAACLESGFSCTAFAAVPDSVGARRIERTGTEKDSG